MNLIKHKERMLNIDLLNACAKGKFFIIDNLLESGADINFIKGNDSPLILAAENNYSEIVRVLLSYGAKINLLNYRAVRLGIHENMKVVDLFTEELGTKIIDILKEEKQIKLAKKITDRLFDEAIKNGNIKQMNVLMDYEVDIHQLRFATTAINSRTLDSLQLLVSKGINLNEHGEQNILTYAILMQKTDSIRYLLENGADIHIQNNLAIKTAIKLKNSSIFSLILNEIKEVTPIADELYHLLKNKNNETSEMKKELDKKILKEKLEKELNNNITTSKKLKI